MFIELQQKPILAQKQIMTPQLKQAIKLLQFSRVDIVEKIQQDLDAYSDAYIPIQQTQRY